jgi:hypothetical protein
MDALGYDTIASIMDEHIGNELTWAIDGCLLLRERVMVS